ncbi:hypothetical protein PR003_g17412 [Phytophthora rubi]|uniref:Uncharacterized protein n=1 Tax=Phytophthora rubi TaxID=129364 RepID=A0A6A3L1L1_9STRA|nr:hypothetical protein PR001_g16380 [Phytophthora rubi]KAE9321661.1 hypothetical protein PR003_g17412 [Phytophthora rubi]
MLFCYMHTIMLPDDKHRWGRKRQFYELRNTFVKQ